MNGYKALENFSLTGDNLYRLMENTNDSELIKLVAYTKQLLIDTHSQQATHDALLSLGMSTEVAQLLLQKIIAQAPEEYMEPDNERAFMETVLRLDANDQLADLLDFIHSTHYDVPLKKSVLRQLLGQSRFRSAYILAKTLLKSGQQNIHTSIALCICGLYFNLPDEMELGKKALSTQINSLSTNQLAELFDTVLTPIIFGFLGDHIRNPNHPRLLQLLEICTIAIPHFGKIFDPNPKLSPALFADKRRQDQEKARIVYNPLPPTDQPRPVRRVVIFSINDYGRARLVAAMNAYGWQAEGVDFGAWQDRHTAPTEAFIATMEICQQKNADLLIMPMCNMTGPHTLKVQEMISLLKQKKPALKVVAFEGDAWMLNMQMLGSTPDGFDAGVATNMKRIIPFVDVVWTSDSPSQPLWDTPDFIHKMLHTQMPHAVPPGNTKKPLTSSILNAGGYRGYTWPRAFWIELFKHHQMPILTKEHLFYSDGLPPLESYANHFKRLTEATCCLNLTMRQNMVCIVTHRSFEVPLSGALLVQEQGTTSDMHRYFISGKHYLEFETLAELADIIHFITTNRDEAEAIRRSGHAFACMHYNDDKLVGYLDKKLFFPG